MAAIAASLPEHQVVALVVAPAAPAADRTSRASCLAHACAVFVRVWRHHQLHRDVCRRERRDAQEPVLDRPCYRDALARAHRSHDFGDRYGYKRVFVPCLVLISLGLACLAAGGTRSWMLLSALIFGVGFRERLSVLHRLRDARRHCRPPWRRVRRNSRGFRLRHRHGIDDDGMGDSALWVSRGVWRRRRAFRVRAPSFLVVDRYVVNPSRRTNTAVTPT